jgi:uncharacterized membrane protein
MVLASHPGSPWVETIVWSLSAVGIIAFFAVTFWVYARERRAQGQPIIGASLPATTAGWIQSILVTSVSLAASIAIGYFTYKRGRP